MSKEYRNKKGEIFWTDACAKASKLAIDFALDNIEDHYDRIEFLASWRDGDLAPWPDFLAKVEAT